MVDKEKMNGVGAQQCVASPWDAAPLPKPQDMCSKAISFWKLVAGIWQLYSGLIATIREICVSSQWCRIFQSAKYPPSSPISSRKAELKPGTTSR